MFPLQDETRRPSHFPIVTVVIVALNTLVFMLELAGGEGFEDQRRLAGQPADFDQSYDSS
jgi:hypothetical protein